MANTAVSPASSCAAVSCCCCCCYCRCCCCRRCEADKQFCHYSLKAKSGPKPNSVRKPKSPLVPPTGAGRLSGLTVIAPMGGGIRSTPAASSPVRERGGLTWFGVGAASRGVGRTSPEEGRSASLVSNSLAGWLRCGGKHPPPQRPKSFSATVRHTGKSDTKCPYPQQSCALVYSAAPPEHASSLRGETEVRRQILPEPSDFPSIIEV